VSDGRRTTAVVVGLVVVAIGLGGLLVQAGRGTASVAAQRSARVVADARLDEAYYSCVDRQARSLIGPSTPVAYRPGASLGEAVVLNKAVASWITLSPPGTEPAGWLGLRHTGGPQACLGDVVTLRVRDAKGSWTLRTGHGASVPGQGPPPAPPL
jgi:hypothetical protein